MRCSRIREDGVLSCRCSVLFLFRFYCDPVVTFLLRLGHHTTLLPGCLLLEGAIRSRFSFLSAPS
jgi:hypothetical protein